MLRGAGEAAQETRAAAAVRALVKIMPLHPPGGDAAAIAERRILLCVPLPPPCPSQLQTSALGPGPVAIPAWKCALAFPATTSQGCKRKGGRDWGAIMSCRACPSDLRTSPQAPPPKGSTVSQQCGSETKTLIHRLPLGDI